MEALYEQFEHHNPILLKLFRDLEAKVKLNLKWLSEPQNQKAGSP